jgi:16S rRNA (guanine527-N7)-methyltransferase
LEKSNTVINEVLEYYKISETKEREQKIVNYLTMLEKRNSWAGLTSRDFKRDEEKAIIDSISVLSVIESEEKKCVLDIGSGGGIVGVVMSIICTNWDIVMVESSVRKATFLTEVIGKLGLANARIERNRVEDMAGRFSFDVILGRAVGKLREVAPRAIDLLLPGGLFIAIKGSKAEAEAKDAVEAIEGSGGKLIGIRKPCYPDELGIPDRVSLVVVRKI